jgi:hypothetical protein
VWASTIAAAIVTILAWILTSVGVDLPVEVAGAITVILVFVAGFLKLDPARS